MLEFHSHNSYYPASVASVYILGYAVGVGLLLISPLTKIYGRVFMYHYRNFIFLVSTCLCAVTKYLSGLVIARFFAGCGGSSAFALAPGSVADIVRVRKRGGVMALVTVACYLGPSMSPLEGSHVAGRWGWRWVFWMTMIMGAFCAVLAFVGLSETYEPMLLERKAIRLRINTHNTALHSRHDLFYGGKSHGRTVIEGMLRPLRMFLSPPLLVISFLTAVGYSYMYILYITFPQIFLVIYDWQPKNIGYAYLGTAAGSLLGMIVGGGISDVIVKRRVTKGDTRPKNRLIPMIFFWPMVGVGLLMYGWTAQKALHWIYPMIGTAIFGAGAISAIFFSGSYIVDAYTTHSASGMAASMLCRSLLGGVVPLTNCIRSSILDGNFLFWALRRLL